jgi:hypothetical protein
MPSRSLRSNGPTRTSSPFVALERPSPLPSIEVEKEQSPGQSSWVEPEPRPPGLSLEDYGPGRGFGVLKNIQPLGTLPPTKLRIKLKNRNYLWDEDVASTPEDGTPAPLESVEAPPPLDPPPPTTETSFTMPPTKVEDEDEDYRPSGMNGTASRSARQSLPNGVAKSPRSGRTTQSRGSPASRKSSIFRSAFDAKTLSDTVEQAVERFNSAGEARLGQAVEQLHQEAQHDPNIAALIDAILLQNATTEQFDQYAEHLRRVKKQIKHNNKAAILSEFSDNPISMAAVQDLLSRPASATIRSSNKSSHLPRKSFFISSNLSKSRRRRSSSASSPSINPVSPISPTPHSEVNHETEMAGRKHKLAYTTDYVTRSMSRSKPPQDGATPVATASTQQASASTNTAKTAKSTGNRTRSKLASTAQPDTSLTSKDNSAVTEADGDAGTEHSNTTAKRGRGRKARAKAGKSEKEKSVEQIVDSSASAAENTTTSVKKPVSGFGNLVSDAKDLYTTGSRRPPSDLKMIPSVVKGATRDEINSDLSEMSSNESGKSRSVPARTEDADAPAASEVEESQPVTKTTTGKARKPAAKKPSTKQTGKPNLKSAQFDTQPAPPKDAVLVSKDSNLEAAKASFPEAQDSSLRFDPRSRRAQGLLVSAQQPTATVVIPAADTPADADILSSGLSSPADSSDLSSARPTPNLEPAKGRKRKASAVSSDEATSVGPENAAFPDVKTTRQPARSAKRTKIDRQRIKHHVSERFEDGKRIQVSAGISPQKNPAPVRSGRDTPGNDDELEASHDLCDACGGDGHLPRTATDPFACNPCRLDGERDQIMTDEDNAVGFAHDVTLRSRVLLPGAFELNTKTAKYFDGVLVGPLGEFREASFASKVPAIPPARVNDWKNKGKRGQNDKEFWETEEPDTLKILQGVSYCGICGQSTFEDIREIITCNAEGCNLKVHADCLIPPRALAVRYTDHKLNERRPFYCERHMRRQPAVSRTANPFGLTVDANGKAKREIKLRAPLKPRQLRSGVTRGVRNNGNIIVELDDSDHEYDPRTQSGSYVLPEKSIQLDFIAKIKLNNVKQNQEEYEAAFEARVKAETERRVQEQVAQQMAEFQRQQDAFLEQFLQQPMHMQEAVGLLMGLKQPKINPTSSVGETAVNGEAPPAVAAQNGPQTTPPTTGKAPRARRSSSIGPGTTPEKRRQKSPERRLRRSASPEKSRSTRWTPY